MLRTQYQKVGTLGIQEIVQMHALFEANYAFSPLSTFMDDLAKKEGVFVVRKKSTQEIVGFSTLGVYWFELGGKRVKGLFSGDTIVDRAYWGSRSLQTAFAFKLFIEALKSPFTKQYWLLISKGYKTYLLLSKNFPDFYPRRGEANPALQDLVCEYCEAMFPGKLDRETMLLDFGQDANCLKEHVASIGDELRQREPDVRFFEQRNPTWQRGTELPCIALADLKTFATALPVFLWKAWRKPSASKQATAGTAPRQHSAG